MNTDNYYTNLNTNIRFTDDISFKLLGLGRAVARAEKLVTRDLWRGSFETN